MSDTFPPSAPNHTDRFRRLLSHRSWQLYSALALSTTLAGAGIYWLTRSNKDKKDHHSVPERPGAPLPSVEEYDSLSDETVARLSPEERHEIAHRLKSRGNAAFSAKQWETAADFYTQALRFEICPVFYANRGACYSNLGLTDLVLHDCNEALKLDPCYVKALLRRAHAHEKLGVLGEALYDFTCVCLLEGFRNESAARAMERLLKQITEAKAKEMIKAKPPRLPSPTFVSAYLDSFKSEMKPSLSEAGNSGDAFYARAYRAMQEKDYDVASSYCDKAIDLGCSSKYLARAYNMQGTFLFLKGLAGAAMERFQRSIAADPGYVQSYIKLSSVYLEQGNYVETYKQFEQAIALERDDPDIYYHRGQAEYIGGNYEAAARDYVKTIELNDTFVYAHIQLGVVQYKLGQTATAMATFLKTLAKFPDSSDVRNYYGELLADQQKIPEATAMFDKAIALDPHNPLPLINMAMLMYQAMANVDEALRLCKQALEVDPACDAAVASLAQILLEQGKPEEAIKYYEMAIGLARTQSELEHAISYVEATKSQIRFAKEHPQVAHSLRGD